MESPLSPNYLLPKKKPTMCVLKTFFAYHFQQVCIIHLQSTLCSTEGKTHICIFFFLRRISRALHAPAVNSPAQTRIHLHKKRLCIVQNPFKNTPQLLRIYRRAAVHSPPCAIHSVHDQLKALEETRRTVLRDFLINADQAILDSWNLLPKLCNTPAEAAAALDASGAAVDSDVFSRMALGVEEKARHLACRMTPSYTL